jgi:hypothetical protein
VEGPWRWGKKVLSPGVLHGSCESRISPSRRFKKKLPHLLAARRLGHQRQKKATQGSKVSKILHPLHEDLMKDTLRAQLIFPVMTSTGSGAILVLLTVAFFLTGRATPPSNKSGPARESAKKNWEFVNEGFFAGRRARSPLCVAPDGERRLSRARALAARTSVLANQGPQVASGGHTLREVSTNYACKGTVLRSFANHAPPKESGRDTIGKRSEASEQLDVMPLLARLTPLTASLLPAEKDGLSLVPTRLTFHSGHSTRWAECNSCPVVCRSDAVPSTPVRCRRLLRSQARLVQLPVPLEYHGLRCSRVRLRPADNG